MVTDPGYQKLKAACHFGKFFAQAGRTRIFGNEFFESG
jgi:hypothetical protein